jgi:hypothetical protein
MDPNFLAGSITHDGSNAVVEAGVGAELPGVNLPKGLFRIDL